MRVGLRSLARRLRPPRLRPRILMYHRVAALDRDPWGLSVHPKRFAEQLDVLRRKRTPLPLDDFVARLRAGRLPADAVAVTFDDGYIDNLRHARPALASAGVPATLFLATGATGNPDAFWWDELARMVLARPTPLSASVPLAGEIAAVALDWPEPADADRAWRAWEQPASARQATYVALWRRLKELTPANRRDAMATLRAAFGRDDPGDDRAMSEDEVRELIADDLVRLGGHTAHHSALPTLSAAAQRQEVMAGRDAIAALTGAPPAGFAYPYGATCAVSREIVADCGFAYACTTERDAPMTRAADPYALPRLGVEDVDGAVFERALAA